MKRFASEFTSGQKAVTVAAAIAVVIGAFAFMSFSGKPSYTPLFTNLQPSDAANITSKLTTDKVPYQLADGGTTILVPASDVDQERLSLAQAGSAGHQHGRSVAAGQGGHHQLEHDPAGRLPAGPAG